MGLKRNKTSTRPSRPVIGSLDLRYPPLQWPSLKCAIKIFELARIGDHRSIGDRGHSSRRQTVTSRFPYPSGGVFFRFFFFYRRTNRISNSSIKIALLPCARCTDSLTVGVPWWRLRWVGRNKITLAIPGHRFVARCHHDESLVGEHQTKAKEVHESDFSG